LPCGSGKNTRVLRRGSWPSTRSPRRTERDSAALARLLRRLVKGTILGHEIKPGSRATSARGVLRHLRAPARDPCGTSSAVAAGRNPFPEEFKPDRLGVLFIRSGENENRLYPAFAGRDPDEALLAWIVNSA